MINFQLLIEAGVHFGHQKSRWHPKMRPYIWGHRGGVHLIDVAKTASQLERAAKFLEQVAQENKTILWVGTKKVAQGPIREVAAQLKTPFVTHRWIGGTITNHSQVKKSVTKLLYFEDIVARADAANHTKKELAHYRKITDRLQKNVGGIAKLSWPIGALVLIDIGREATALKEAFQCGVPVVALVDTNYDPNGIDFMIPGNDDSPKSVRLVIEYLAAAAQRGYEKAAQEHKAAPAATVVLADLHEDVAKQVDRVLAEAEEDAAGQGRKKPETGLRKTGTGESTASKKPGAHGPRRPSTGTARRPAIKK
ncbi:MAG TPA: 30S ribosomal protein S2 [Candidatus Babeliales bacterium]|nr:30S ribosomal protein S2 [Candidatus Babeliales bacterium]